MKVASAVTHSTGYDYTTTVETDQGVLIFGFDLTDAILVKNIVSKNEGEWGVSFPLRGDTSHFALLMKENGVYSLTLSKDRVVEFDNIDSAVIADSIVDSYEKTPEFSPLRLVS